MNTIKRIPGSRFLLIAISVLASIAVSGCGEEPEEKHVVRPIRAMAVSDVTQFRQRKFPGIAKATQEIDLSFRINGPLITRPVDVGDAVKKGAVVARIDPRDFEVQLNNVRGQLDRAKANAVRAESEYQREINILQQDPGATSQTNVDRKLAQRDESVAEVKSLEAAVDAAQDDLGYTYLKAPFTGVVVSTFVENFQQVQAKQPIVRIVDNSRVEMIINIPEGLISMVPSATNIEVIFDRYPEVKVPAEIKEIGAEASATTRTFPVTLIMEQPGNVEILPGMAGNATGEPSQQFLEDIPSGIQVPISAIFSPDDIEKTYTWVIDKDSSTVSKREVKTGQITNTGIIVTEGLNAGEVIAIAGVHYLNEGMEVRILEDEAQ